MGVTTNDITDVVIPDNCLENADTIESYNLYAYIYLTTDQAGGTGYKITIPVKTRAKPETFDGPEEQELFKEAIKAVNNSANSATQSEKVAEAWAHGHKEFPDQDKDNAAYYATQAKNAAASVSGRVSESKKEIDNYVKEKEEALKGETGNVYFAAFKVVNGRLIMCSDPNVDKVCFHREGSRLKYRLAL